MPAHTSRKTRTASHSPHVGEFVNTRSLKSAQAMAQRAQRTASASAKKMLNAGQMKLRKAARVVGTSVNKNPWGYIAGFAAGAAAVGYLFGRKRHVGLKEVLT